MATTIRTESPTSDVAEDAPHRMTSVEFLRLLEAEVFDPRRRVFLWDGRLYEKMAKTAAHAQLANLFNQALARRLPEGWFLSAENPLALSVKDVPLPDFTVVSGDPMALLKENRHVEPRDVALVVEIAVTSLPRDLGDRRSRYASGMAAAGGTYIVVDGKGHCFWIHEEPVAGPDAAEGGTWNTIARVGPGEFLRLSLRGRELAPIPWEEVMR